jgi:hypothetical protein
MRAAGWSAAVPVAGGHARPLTMTVPLCPLLKVPQPLGRPQTSGAPKTPAGHPIPHPFPKSRAAGPPPARSPASSSASRTSLSPSRRSTARLVTP